MNLNNIYGELSDKDFKRISSYIYEHYGINLYPNKRVLLKSRLQNRLSNLGFSNYTDYCDYVLNSNDGAKESLYMIDRVSTNKTDFFREAEHFDFLSNQLLINYFANSNKSCLNIWSAGCSSGEEAYTLAITMEEFNILNKINYKIFASDISISVLETAKKAIYPYSSINLIPQKFKTKYFLKSKDQKMPLVRLKPSIRSKVNFFRHNLLEDETTLKEKMDIIFCRNTLIYFDRKTQEKVINKLLNKLDKDGYLFLGHSESLININVPLKHISPAVYKKI